MELYVGMDVSLERTSICVVDGRGEIVSEGVVNSEPAAIAELIGSRAKEAVRIGLETGPTATWLWHELRAMGLPVICIDARRAKSALSPQINKSDRNDAIGGGGSCSAVDTRRSGSRACPATRSGRFGTAGP